MGRSRLSSGGPGSQFRPGNNIDGYVRKEIEKTAWASAENRMNAIAADGMPVVYYQKTATGPLCTCQSREDRIPVEEIYPIDDAGEPQTIEQMIRPAPAFGRYAQRTETEDQDLTGNMRLDTAPSAGISRLAFDHGDGVACGICFRTGYEAGYQLSSGLRVMLTARNPEYLGPNTDLAIAELPNQLRCLTYRRLNTQSNPTVNPISPTSSYVSWITELPFVWDSIRANVFLNDQPHIGRWSVEIYKAQLD